MPVQATDRSIYFDFAKSCKSNLPKTTTESCLTVTKNTCRMTSVRMISMEPGATVCSYVAQKELPPNGRTVITVFQRTYLLLVFLVITFKVSLDLQVECGLDGALVSGPTRFVQARDGERDFVPECIRSTVSVTMLCKGSI